MMLRVRSVHRRCSDVLAVHRSMSDVRSCTSIDAQTYVAHAPAQSCIGNNILINRVHKPEEKDGLLKHRANHLLSDYFLVNDFLVDG